MTAPITFHVQDPDGHPINGALVDAGVWKGLTGITDPPGDFCAQLTPGHYDLTVTAAGFAPRSLPADLADPGTVTIGLDRLSSSLRTQGRDFVNGRGERIVLCGTDQFPALRMELDGADLQPLIQESLAFGFNVWRIFGMGSKAQNGMLDLRPSEPGFYAATRRLCERLNAHGLIPLLTCYVDNQDVQASPDHWLRFADAARGTDTLLSGFNEWSKNKSTFGPEALRDPGMLWSRGSDLGDVAPFRPYASFAEFHPRRDWPKAEMDAVASALTLYTEAGLNVPLLIDEPPRMGTDGSGSPYDDPRACERFARIYGEECAGAVFHSRAGQRGSLMDPLTRACAEAWVRGMRP